jgi:hypothetical protein
MWDPDPPVMAARVAPSGPYRFPMARSWTSPPLRGSTSSTICPGCGRSPMFASGHIAHHLCTAAVSEVASSFPCRVRGCFPGCLHSLPRQEHRLGVSAGECSGRTSAPPTA